MSNEKFYLRKLLHLSILLVVYLPRIVGYFHTKVILLVLTFTALTIEFLRARSEDFNSSFLKITGMLMKEKEKRGISGATYMLLSTTTVALLWDRLTFEFVVFVAVLVDGITPVVAGILREPPERKDLAHFITFTALAFVISVLSYHPIPLYIKILSGLTIGVMEFADFYPDDNVWAPISGALVMHLLLYLS